MLFRAIVSSPTNINNFYLFAGIYMSCKPVNTKLIKKNQSKIDKTSLKFDDFQVGFIDFHIDI